MATEIPENSIHAFKEPAEIIGAEGQTSIEAANASIDKINEKPFSDKEFSKAM